MSEPLTPFFPLTPSLSVYRKGSTAFWFKTAGTVGFTLLGEQGEWSLAR